MGVLCTRESLTDNARAWKHLNVILFDSKVLADMRWGNVYHSLSWRCIFSHKSQLADNGGVAFGRGVAWNGLISLFTQVVIGTIRCRLTPLTLCP